MHKPSEIRDYVIAILIGTALTIFLSLYLLVRRGYLFDAPDTADAWYVPNKAIVGAGTLMLAFTFLLGPLVRYFDRFDAWVRYRKEIGIVGGLLAVGHGLISFFLVPKKFPHEKMFTNPDVYLWGLAGVVTLVFLFAISFRRMIDLIGSERWWLLQRWGLRLAVIFTVLHVVPMKWSGWAKWFFEGGKVTPELAHPLMPGVGILVSVFVAWVILIRLYESAFIFKSFGFQTKDIAGNETLKNNGRRFILTSFWVMMIAYVILITRWM